MSKESVRRKRRCSAKAVPAKTLIVDGIDLSKGIRDRPDLCCIAVVEAGEVQLLIGEPPAPSGTSTPIYPTGYGPFALGSPDGPVLEKGACVEVMLAGTHIPGTILTRSLGDYLQCADGTVCGLTAGMRVVVSVDPDLPNPEQTERTPL
jgi:hypothetical protein